MADKKFYWMKMTRDFFKRHDVKILESKGPEFAYCYMKLMGESLDHEGCLRFSEKTPYTVEILAPVIGEDPDVLDVTIDLLLELEMLEIWDDGTYFLPYVSEMLGSESKWAEKKRAQRQKEDSEGKCPENVPKMSDRDKSIEIRDKSLENRTDDLSLLDRLNAREQKDLKKACGGSKGFDQLMRYADHQVKHRNEPSPISDYFQYVKQIGVNGGFITDG